MGDIENKVSTERFSLRSLAQSREPMDRVQAALAYIENAQSELSRATAVLSTLRYFHPQCQQIGRLHDRVHQHWYKIKNASEKKAHKLALDELSLQACEKREAMSTAAVAAGFKPLAIVDDREPK
jgi:DNA repair ATPase RecN